jgi:alpha-L-fucosidase 2
MIKSIHKRSRVASMFLTFMLGSTAISDAQSARDSVDFESFLSRHDLVWNTMPNSRNTSAFIGNGMMGATIWAGKGEALRWELGRNDVYSTGESLCSRMPIGKLVLHLEGEATGFQMRQSLYRAVVFSRIETDRGGLLSLHRAS